MEDQLDLELDEFLDEWKEELRKDKVISWPGDKELDEDCEEYLEKRIKTIVDEYEVPTCTSYTYSVPNTEPNSTCTRLSAIIGGPSLFILPSTESTGDGDISTKQITSNVLSQSTASTATLVDKLISDLDEINTVPFFDIQLPKEIAIVIFNYLSVVDLCHCAMVSHSWRVLAEDNLLWIAICQRMSYSTDIVDSTNIHWKTVVKELILNFRQIQRNWMERKCTVHTYQPVSVGSLSTAVYLNKEILACYSTGQCHLWSLLTKEVISFPSSQTTPTCVAMSDQIGCHGDANGNLVLFSMDQVQTYHHKVHTRVHSVSIACNSAYHAVAFASGGYSPFSSLTVLCSKDIELTDWYSTSVRLPNSAQLRNFQIQKVTILPSLKEADPFLVMFSTQSHLTLQSPHESFSKAIHFLGEEGIMCCINCYSVSPNHSSVICGTLDCGYHQVRLFDLYSGISKESFRGHYGKVNCVEYDKVKDSNFKIISGGDDKRLNIYDGSSSYPVMKLSGISSPVVCVQLEGWKVCLYSRDGTVAVWDLRIGQELWRTQDRHCVSLCEIDRDYLIAGHVPPQGPSHTCSSDISHDESPLHSRYCGSLKIYDFSVDCTGYTKTLPSICSSSYDEPSASFYNLNLLYPYDIIQQ